MGVDEKIQELYEELRYIRFLATEEGIDGSLTRAEIEDVRQHGPGLDKFADLDKDALARAIVDEQSYEKRSMYRLFWIAYDKAAEARAFLDEDRVAPTIRFVQTIQALYPALTFGTKEFSIGNDKYTVPTSELVNEVNTYAIGYISNPACKDCLVADMLFATFGISKGVSNGMLVDEVPMDPGKRHGHKLTKFGGVTYGSIIENDATIPKIFLYDKHRKQDFQRGDFSGVGSPIRIFNDVGSLLGYVAPFR